MFDLKVIHSVLSEMEEERGISREKMMDAIEQALATAYKKEYGKRGQIVRANFDINSGATIFNQIKIVVDESMLKSEDEEDDANQIKDKVPATRLTINAGKFAISDFYDDNKYSHDPRTQFLNW